MAAENRSGSFEAFSRSLVGVGLKDRSAPAAACDHDRKARADGSFHLGDGCDWHVSATQTFDDNATNAGINRVSQQLAIRAAVQFNNLNPLFQSARRDVLAPRAPVNNS